QMMRVHRAMILSPLLFVLGCAVTSDDAQESIPQTDESTPQMDDSLSASDLMSLPPDDTTVSPQVFNCKSAIVTVLAANGTVGKAICRFGLTVVRNYNSQNHAFLIGTDNAVYHTWLNPITHVGGGWERDAGFATDGVRA